MGNGQIGNCGIGLYFFYIILKGVQRHYACEVGNLVTTSGFKGGIGAMPPNLTPNKFRKPSGPPRMPDKLLVVGTPFLTPLVQLTALHQIP